MGTKYDCNNLPLVVPAIISVGRLRPAMWSAR